jgi:hypothetical protein
MKRREFLIAGSGVLLSACAPSKPLGVYETTEVPAPKFRAGQEWVHRRTDGFNQLPRGVLTRRVEEANADRIRMVTTDENGRILDDAVFSSPGVQHSGTLSEEGPIIGRIQTAWRRYDFPLVAGKRWQDRFYIDRTDGQGGRNFVQLSTWVEGWEEVELDGRMHRALIIRRDWNLDRRSFWQGTLYRRETEWYAPAIAAPVRWVTREEYIEAYRVSLFSSLAQGDWFIYRLESFKL